MTVHLPIVLLPGLDGTALLRAPFAGQLGLSCPVQIIAYPDDPALDYAALERLVRSQLPAEGRFVVLGESFSGPLAIRIAHAYPDRCAGLILVSTFARSPWPAWLAPAVHVLDERKCPDRWIEAVMLGAHGTPEAIAALRQVSAALPREVLQARARAALTVDVRRLLAETKCPVLCLHGRSDWLIRAKCAREIVKLRPDATMVWLEGAHNLLMTHIEAATREITRFSAGL
jgi:pimeloyl-ACP methyl ester carboxylesterase